MKDRDLGEKAFCVVNYGVRGGVASAALIDAIRLANFPSDIAHHRLYREVLPVLQDQGVTVSRTQESSMYHTFTQEAFNNMGGYARGTFDWALIFAAIVGPLAARFVARRIGGFVQSHFFRSANVTA